MGLDHRVVCPSETELVAFLARDLAPAQADSVEEHFGSCDDCRHLVFALAVEGSHPPAPRATAVEIGAAVDRFTIEERIAAGGMGVVYRAHDPTLRRDVALKLVHLGSSLAQADAQARLLREAQGLAQLDHPNVVTVFDAGTHDREVFIAMELVDGVSLDRWLAERPREWRAVAAVLEQAGRGLAAAHAAGLVHRDIKPANVMIATDGRVKVVDFGLARALIDLEPAPAAKLDEDLHARLTLSGALVGTPAYCAPEQLVGEQVDIRSDVFSFCVTFCEAVFGRRPFAANTAGELIRRMKDPSGPDLPAVPALPKRLLALLRRGLAIDPAERLPALEPLLAELARRPRRRGPLIAGGVAFAAAVPLALFAMSGSDEEACAASHDEIAQSWSFARRAEVGHAILATQVPFAPDTWRRVEATLDGYATRWVDLHGETCRATAVHHTQSDELLDRRMACLAGARSQLDASVATLAKVDRDGVRSALRVVEGLPNLATCAETSTLLAVAPVPPAQLVDVERVRGVIAQAAATYRVGAYEKALEIARRGVKDAEQIAYRPLVASAFYTLAMIEEQLPMRQQTRADYERAIDEAAASGSAELEATALADLAELVRSESPDGKLANTLARHAVAIVERIHGPPALAAKVRLVSARAQLGLDNVAARAQLDLVGKALAVEPGANHELRMAYELTLLRLEPESEHVKSTLLRLLAEGEKLFGANHPNLVFVLNELVDNASLWEATDEARAYADRISQIMAPYPGHDVVVRRLAASLEADPVKRRPLLEQLVRDAETAYGPSSPQVATLLDDLAGTLDDLGEQMAARPLIERAIQIWEGAYGSSFELLVTAYEMKATVYQRTDLATAAAAAEHAAMLANQPGVQPVTKTTNLITLGEIYFRQGRYAETLETMTKFRPLLTRMVEEDNPLFMTLDFVDAACRYELERDRAQLRRARDIHVAYRKLRGVEDPQTVRDQAEWLAARN